MRLKLDDAKGAVADATMATELKPDWAKGWARLGVVERNLLEASEAYAQAHDLDPTNKEFDRLLHEVETQYSDGIFHATAGAAARAWCYGGGGARYEWREIVVVQRPPATPCNYRSCRKSGEQRRQQQWAGEALSATPLPSVMPRSVTDLLLLQQQQYQQRRAKVRRRPQRQRRSSYRKWGRRRRRRRRRRLPPSPPPSPPPPREIAATVRGAARW